MVTVPLAPTETPRGGVAAPIGAPGVDISGIQQLARAATVTGLLQRKAEDQRQVNAARATMAEGFTGLDEDVALTTDAQAIAGVVSKGTTSLRETVIKGLNARQWQAFEPEFIRRSAFTGSRASAHRLRVHADDAAADRLRGRDAFLRDWAGATSETDRDAAIAGFEDMLTSDVAAGWMSEASAVAAQQGFVSEGSQNQALQLIDADPARAVEALSDPESIPGLATDDRLRLKGRAETLLAQRRGKVTTAARSALQDMDTVLSAGVPVEPGMLTNTAALVRASGDAALATRFNRTVTVMDARSAMIRMTPVQLQNEINGLRAATATGASVEQAQVLKAAQSVLGQMNTALKEDPLSWAAGAGVEIEPLDATVPESFSDRVATAELVASEYGNPVTYFTNEERHQFVQTLTATDTDVEEQMAMLGGVASNFGSAAPRVMEEISKDAPVMSWIGGLVMDGPDGQQTARMALSGRKALASGTKFDMPIGDVALALDESMGAAMNASPADRSGVIEIAKAVYADRALKAGLTEADAFDSELFDWSVHRAMGGTTDADGNRLGGRGIWNDRELVLPTGLSGRDFDVVLGRMTKDDLQAASVGGVAPFHGNDKGDMTPEDLDDAILVPVGDGIYLVSMNGTGGELVLGSGNNGFYEMNVRAIAPAVIGRLPVARDISRAFEGPGII